MNSAFVAMGSSFQLVGDFIKTLSQRATWCKNNDNSMVVVILSQSFLNLLSNQVLAAYKIITE